MISVTAQEKQQQNISSYMRLNDSQEKRKNCNKWFTKTPGKLEENLRLFHGGLMHANNEARVHAPNKTRGQSLGQDTSSYKFSTVSLHNLTHNLT